ncbi:asparagine synthase (glutamine-hydrolyzing) [Neopusillimonas maritima]|uniref:asparagine synthase (glutamine-hydrolyzing) n=1 Tax=Neopusillimonas maritima TaxID=2026239 RepID=A0A3A1YTR8_9BURK|nr:asparagine synthase (glutamine-hydrolyzing) [Neopusillimonas maritima]RIY41602.1 asparagine synthase (glutamine-hydrolyzing) [Neopusillimonas maritima]
MCGFAGFIDFSNNTDRQASLGRMLDTIGHRGPDDRGVAIDSERGVFLGHQRLAIIDPENGRQPMSVVDNSVCVVFNGVIYNYLELRRELLAKGHPIKSYSDTEVLLYAYIEWGENCVARFIGMFAFAIWDKNKNKVFCARDRIGIKPFYYAIHQNTFVFGSEIKSILASGYVDRRANTAGLKDYITFQFCLDDKTMFEGVSKLEPGQAVTVDLSNQELSVRRTQYWDLQYEIDTSHDESWFVDHLSGLVEDSVRMHLRSDVPLGAHLSGGLDSSAVVCLASELLVGEKVSTFTGAFRDGPQYDETAYAKKVSSFCGTEYNEVYIPGSELSTTLPNLMYYMDEPVAGPGSIPQYYVSKLAADKVKVVLGGQGGDELFIGYARYLVAYLEQCLSGAIYETAHTQPYAVTLESIVPNLPLLKTYKPMLQNLWGDGLFESADKRYFKLIDRSSGVAHLFNDDLLSGNYQPFESFQKIFNRDGLHSLINSMTYFDLKGSLPALLHVEDRTSMAASIESRVPLLDHRIVEFMARIPPNIKFANGRMKHLFKESVRNIVPKEIFERKDKMGFPTPLNNWARGVANDFVKDILLSPQARQRGVYDVRSVEKAINNEQEFGRAVWGMLCMELWHRIHIDQDTSVLNIKS